ncbi:DUF441 domain-containing protein [Anaeromicrobium sediminis]|uniref:UPF0756 membrane protein CCE28_02915 n=1 Tax=Anaeromicrobium sediminis TaxID=1478221 RepID=A0A267MPC7_9FIRM|nr:DUF441 domain-containing protein [Anaeromicrobium sediminis]PAB61396.1 hypothetical protein CCE28_02915 [Anaeromicrobium sediminis]
MSQQYIGNLSLLVLLVLSILGKNNSLAVAITTLMFFSLMGKIGPGFNTVSDAVLNSLDKYGLKLGVILLMMGVLAPFALGQIDPAELLKGLKSYRGWLALLAGVLVAIFGAYGGTLLDVDPNIVTPVVLGTILGIVVFKGYPVGPLIGSGIAYALISMVDALMKK